MTRIKTGESGERYGDWGRSVKTVRGLSNGAIDAAAFSSCVRRSFRAGRSCRGIIPSNGTAEPGVKKQCSLA